MTETEYRSFIREQRAQAQRQFEAMWNEAYEREGLDRPQLDRAETVEAIRRAFTVIAPVFKKVFDAMPPLVRLAVEKDLRVSDFVPVGEDQ